MRLKNNLICLACIILAGLLLTLASSRLKSMHQMRLEKGLVSNAEPLENAPPSLAFATVAMGAFRGLIVDILWMRADKLKEEGQFFDAKQLADWITVLQPRFASVWDFQAWNMAYNISVAVPASQWEERWRWVRNGYELLRDKGIEKNPRSILLYRSLGWIFQHKIGDVADDCHRHYKRELALSMRALMGSPQATGGFQSVVTNEDFERLIKTPKTLSEITSDPEIAKFVEELKTSDDTFKDEGKLPQNYLGLRQNPEKFKPQAFEVIDRFRDTEALEKFDLFAKAHQLRNVWKFDIEFMHKLNKKYGPVSYDDPNEHLPLNWEHPGAHAIYWAALGLERAGTKGEYSVDEKNTDRIIFHSLQQLHRTGKLIVYPVKNKLDSVFLRPDLQMFDSCNDLWTNKIIKYQLLEKANPKAVMGGHKNFLINSLASFYQAGYREKAGQIYLLLREKYSTGPHAGDFSDPLIVFVRKRLAKEHEGIGAKDATEQIIMALREALFQYAVHEDEESYAREQWAREIYDLYQKEMGIDEPGRVGLPEFERMKYMAFVEFMTDMFYPEELRERLLGRIKLERPDVLEKLMKQESIILEKYKQQLQQETN
jgi:hypothetical protein